MKLPFSLFLALRYLKPKRTFVSVITIISILGVTLGITVLILVISVMTGFDRELRRKVLGFDAHLFVTSDSVMNTWREADAKLQKVQHVVATAPFVQGPVIVEYDGRRATPKIRGIDAAREQNVTGIKEFVKSGSFDLAMDAEGNSSKVLLGSQLAAELGVAVGDKLTIYAPGNISAILDELNKARKDPADRKSLDDLQQMILPAELTVTGIFESGHYIYDSEYLLIPLHIAQELYGLGDGLHGLTARLDDANLAPQAKGALLAQLGETDLIVNTWMDLNRRIFEALQIERSTMFFILMFIVIVAAFGIMNTLITVTVQKTREIGIMKALGADTPKIIWVFLSQGMVVGIFGNALGLALGMALIRWRNEFKDWLSQTLHIEIFPASIYQFSAIPAEVVPRDVTVICISAFVVCSLAALIPAYFAARLDPVKALRYE